MDQKIWRDELVNTIKSISNDEIHGKSAWDKYRRKLRIYILENDPRNFLRWDPIKGSMVYGGNKAELDHLISSNWNKWSEAIKETWVGNPPKYLYYKKAVAY